MRVRYDSSGRLRTRLAGDTLESWENALASGGLRVRFDGPGFEWNGHAYRASNNAWGIGNQTIDGVTDFARDPEDASLWIATVNRGLFRVLLNRLVPPTFTTHW